MNVIEVVELDDKGVAVNNDSEVVNYFDDNGDFPDGNYPTEDGKPINIAGEWLLINDNIEVDNDYLVYAQRSSDGITLVQLPGKYVEEDYLVEYNAKDECPLGVDVLVRENGFNVRVVRGCDYQNQANVNNHLDGHKYSGYLGFKLNDDYFVTYRNEQFQMISL